MKRTKWMIIWFVLLALIVGMSVLLSGCKKSPADLKCGYIDSKGNFVIQPSYSMCGDFSEGLADVAETVINGRQFKYIDKNGSVIFDAKFSYDSKYGSVYGVIYPRQFNSGYAPVPNESGGCVYIDRNGKKAFQRTFKECLEFENGAAGVCVERHKCGFVDQNGKPLTKLEYAFPKSYFNGWAIVKVHETMSSFVNNKGKKISNIDTDFKDKDFYANMNLLFEITPFSEGFAFAQLEEAKWCLINTKDLEGKDVSIKCQIVVPYEKVNSFHEGLAAVGNDNGIGFINNKGDLVIPLKYKVSDWSDNVGFFEGLAAVQEIASGKFGFIDKTGQNVIGFQFENAGRFSEGLAAVKINGKWGFINKKGDLVINPIFNDAGPYKRIGHFSGGLAAVYSDQ